MTDPVAPPPPVLPVPVYIPFAAVDVTGLVLRFGTIQGGPLEAEALARNGGVIVTEAQYHTLRTGGRFNLINGVLTPNPLPGPTIAELRAEAVARVNRLAEAARSRLIAQGNGDIIEFVQLRTESLAISVGPGNPIQSDYPMLSSEYTAYQTGGGGLSFKNFVPTVTAALAPAVTTLASIRQIRLAANLQIQAATTKPQIDAIVAGLTWPV